MKHFFKAYSMLTVLLTTVSSSAAMIDGDGVDKDVASLTPSLRGSGNNNGVVEGREGGIIRELLGCPVGNVNDGCSVFCPCSGSNTCEAWHHVCRAPGKENDPCHLTRPCGDGFTCEAGTHVCRGPSKVNEACHATRPCGDGLTCEAGTHVCRAPGKENDPCHLTRPCGDGLTCEAFAHVCRASSKVNEACHATRPCDSGLHCEAGTHVCREPGKFADPCHLTRPCDSGFTCSAAVCVPECTNFDSDTQKRMKDFGFGGDFFENDPDRSDRSVVGHKAKWDGGIVPYQADCGLESWESIHFARAMKHIEENTGIRFVMYDSAIHKNWIILTDIHEGGRFAQFVGRLIDPGWQIVNVDVQLNFNAFGIAVHELVHILGWEHTQARPDRNDYITINYDNMDSDSWNDFEKVNSTVYQAVQKCRDYNYESVMHYGGTSASNNGKLTIETKDPSKQDLIGQFKGLNEQDKLEIDEYYFGVPACLDIGSIIITPCQFKLHRNPGVNNWNEANDFCKAQGGDGSTLASLNEICPNGFNSIPAFGQQNGDQWIAYSEMENGVYKENGWVNVGTWGGQYTCLTHLQAAGENPDWGLDQNKETYESNFVYCHECPRDSWH